MSIEEPDNWRYEILIETDQKMIRPRIKVRNGFSIADAKRDLDKAVELFFNIREQFSDEGFVVAPVKVKYEKEEGDDLK